MSTRIPTRGALRLDVGARVVTNGHPGTVRFVGPTQFAAGEWIGIELDTRRVRRVRVPVGRSERAVGANCPRCAQ
jgi:hypothetical protein